MLSAPRVRLESLRHERVHLISCHDCTLRDSRSSNPASHIRSIVKRGPTFGQLVKRARFQSSKITICASTSPSAKNEEISTDHDPVSLWHIDSFEEVVRARHTAREFDPNRELPEGVLQRCLALAARAPTSFNTQPYKVVVVQSKEAKQKLSEAMTGEGNIQRVLKAPATLVWLADNGVVRYASKVASVAEAAGAPPEFFKKIPLYVAIFSGGFSFLGSVIKPLGSLINFVAFICRKVALSIASYIMVVPTPSTAEAWSFKNTSLPAAFFTLAATACGLYTSIMEGFDSRRVCSALKVPGNYSVPMMVAVGYSTHGPPAKISSRNNPKELFYSNDFGTPFESPA
mmetsp:Transcript_44226/g.84566  ORF Transcript_44226/g.84566 Transcript_44226/m.84566 type:complete len:344 (+) Transcript_44226:177-1208(+)